jgi:hypothetical protein
MEIRYARIARRTPEIYPDFMCIGAPRAATTWLYDRLRADPRVFLPRMKELHFFDEERPDDPEDRSGLRWHRSFYFDMSDPAHMRWYWRQFRNARDRPKGEITPAYSTLSATRVRLIFDKIPRLRIIYILRNPIDRAWSSLRKMVWYQKGARHRLMRDRDWLLRTVMHPELLERGDYRNIIETWEGIFPHENFLYLFHDDIEADEQRVLGRVYAFLNLTAPDLSQLAGKRVNAAPPTPMPDNVRSFLEHRYESQIGYLEERFDRDLGHWRKAPRLEPVLAQATDRARLS